MTAQIRITPGTVADAAWIRTLIPRLHAFGPPGYRDVSAMNSAEASATLAALAGTTGENAVLVAQDASATGLGFVHLETAVDFFTRERHGHISTLVVAPSAE